MTAYFGEGTMILLMGAIAIIMVIPAKKKAPPLIFGLAAVIVGALLLGAT